MNATQGGDTAMNEAIRPLYEACLDCVRALCELDPSPDSAEGRLLIGLASACEEYEQAHDQLWRMNRRE